MSCLTQRPPAVDMAVKYSMETMTPERLLNRMPDLKRNNRSNRHDYAHHRKSAVELLEASKSTYVKSSLVLNHRQELKHPENLSVSSRETCTVLSLSHSKSDFELQRAQADKWPEDIDADKVAASDDSVHKSNTPPPIPPRKHSPAASKGVEVQKTLCRHSPVGVKTINQSTDSPVINMSDPEKTKLASFTCGSTGTSNQDQIVKRFSSLSASAAVTVSKDQSDREVLGAERGSATSTRSNGGKDSHQSSSTSGSPLKPMCYNSLSTSVGVLVEQPRPRIHKLEKMEESSEVPRRRQLHRSHSDLSSCRHSRTSSDFSDLSSRLSRTSTEIERFFNEMGLDRSVLDPMLRIQDTKRKDFLDNLSSIDSQDTRSMLSGVSRSELDRVPAESEQDLMERSASGTSVVERNARIIKWLYNVKKARNTGPRQPITSS